MRRKGTPRKSRRNRYYFLVALSFSLFYATFFYRNIGIGIGIDIGIDGIEQVGSSDLFFSPLYNDGNKDFCDSSITASSKNGGIIRKSVFHQWKYIDATIEREFPNKRVSGGIFLYPRQAGILTHLIRRIHAGLGDHRKTITICETGFGSGHSMALFQEASASIGPVRVISFDKFDRPYQLPIWHHFNNTINATTKRQLRDGDNYNKKKSLDFVKGDSCKTVPNHLPSSHCDVLHGSSLCPTDNIDLVENSPCGVLLTSTAMDSLNDRQVYFGPRAQWRKLRERNCISNIVCFREDGALDLKRDFIFAKQGSARTGEFCVAVTTGRCQKGTSSSATISEKCAFDVKQLLIQLDLDKTCSQHQIETPA
jgi:hypothetical protein